MGSPEAEHGAAPVQSNVQLWLDCFFLHNFTSLRSSTGSCRQPSPSTEISTTPNHCCVVPPSLHEGSPYMALAPPLLGSLFQLLLAPGWHLYLFVGSDRMKHGNSCCESGLWKSWTLLRDTQMKALLYGSFSWPLGCQAASTPGKTVPLLLQLANFV